MAEMSARRALLEQLVADGVRHVFGNPGTTEQPFMDMLQEYPQIQFILGLQEAAVVGIADGYARATGRPAFVELHTAGGLGNALGMISNAEKGHTPLVLYAGQTDTRGLAQEPWLRGALVEMARPLTKWAYEVGEAADVPRILRRAMKVAAEPPQGPVFLSIPMNVLDETADVEVVPTSFTRWRVRPEPAAVEEAVKLLAAAERPVLLLGDGVALSDAQMEMVALAETLGARVYGLYACDMVFPTNHPQFVHNMSINWRTPGLRKLFADVDVVLAVGASLFPQLFPDPAPVFAEGTKVIHVDLNGWEIAKNQPVTVGMIGDPKLAGQDILAGLKAELTAAGREQATARAEAAARLKAQRIAAAEQAAMRNWDSLPMPPYRLMKELAGVIGPETVIYEELLSSAELLSLAVERTLPRTFFRGRGNAIGRGLCGAVGVQLAYPDRQVVGLVSDGSSLYTIQALWTAAHHRIPVTWVVCNNSSYRILKLNMLEYLGESAAGRQFVEMDLNNPPVDFCGLANSFGVKAWRVERPEQVAGAVREAMRFAGPALVDVAVAAGVGSKQ